MVGGGGDVYVSREQKRMESHIVDEKAVAWEYFVHAWDVFGSMVIMRILTVSIKKNIFLIRINNES